MSEELEGSWAAGTLCVFDTETTGADPETARIVTASIVMVDVAGEAMEARSWLVNPGVPIPAEATAVHGITDDQARGGMVPAIAVPQIREVLHQAWSREMPVVIFNAVYDLTVLDRELRRHGFPPPALGVVIDPFVIDRELDRYRKGKRTLAAMCEQYRVPLEGAHDATVDALATGALVRAIARRHLKVAEMRPADLHNAQVRWHADRQADFIEYLKRAGKPHDDVHGDWPVRVLKGATV